MEHTDATTDPTVAEDAAAAEQLRAATTAREHVREFVAARDARLAELDALAADETAERSARFDAHVRALSMRAAPMFDEIDAQILTERITAREQLTGPREGDFVVYPAGEVERIGILWADEHGVPWHLQTSKGGTYSLHPSGHLSMSGGLNPSIDPATLTDTGQTRTGSAWFFHHDRWTGHNGVDVSIPCRVFTTTATTSHY